MTGLIKPMLLLPLSRRAWLMRVRIDPVVGLEAEVP